jgi:hypothetical protein
MLLSLLLSIACTPLPTCTFWSDGTPQVSPCATPTPVLQWDQVADADLSGYRVYADGNQFLDLPCEFFDDDEDPLTPPIRFCRGAEFPIPLQRYCGSCLPFFSYSITVKAYDAAGNESTMFSNAVDVCMSPICQAPGPCN